MHTRNVSRCTAWCAGIALATGASGTFANANTINWLSLAPTAVGVAPPLSAAYASGDPAIGPVTMGYTQGSGFDSARQMLPTLQNQSAIDPGNADSYSWGPLELLARTYVEQAATAVSSGLNQGWDVTYTFSNPVPAGSDLVLGIMGLGRRIPEPNETLFETTTVATVHANAGTYSQVGEFIGGNNWGPTSTLTSANSFQMMNAVTNYGGLNPNWNTGLALTRFNNSAALSTLTVHFDQTLGDGVGVNIGFISAVPEPTTTALMWAAALPLWLAMRRRQRSA